MPVLQTIEKKIRRLVLGLLAGNGTISPGTPLLEGLPERPRVLLVRIDRIGDGIVSTPLMCALKERFPDGSTDILLGEKNRVIAPLLPCIRQSFVLGKKVGTIIGIVRELRRNRYDVVVNLHLNRSASASLLSRLARGRYLIEYDGENPFRSDGSSPQHVVELTFNLARPLGVHPIQDGSSENHLLAVNLPEKSRNLVRRTEAAVFRDDSYGRRIFINVSASHLSRNWQDAGYAELAKGLHSNGLVPVLCGLPGDATRIRTIAEASGDVAVILPTAPDYADFAALLNLADIVITPDTSTVHLAAALGKPTVALYASGATAGIWGPWGVPSRAIAVSDGIRHIESADVLAAALELYTSRREADAGISDRSI